MAGLVGIEEKDSQCEAQKKGQNHRYDAFSASILVGKCRDLCIKVWSAPDLHGIPGD